MIAVAFVPWWSGAGTSPKWIIAALSLFALDLRLLPFIAYLFWALDPDTAIRWTIVCAAFSWGLATEDLKPVAVAFAFGVLVSLPVMATQFAGLPLFPSASNWPGGLFVNKNLLGEAACLAIVACLFVRQRVLAVSLTPLLLLSVSRASVIAVFAAVLAMIHGRWRWIVVAGAVVCAAGFWWFGYGSLETLRQRFVLWHGAFGELSWLGNGRYDFSTVTTRDPHLHNDWLQLVYELGVVGLFPLGVLAYCSRSETWPFILALVVIGSFGFPMQSPATAWFGTFVIGHFLGLVGRDGRDLLRQGLA